MTRLRVVVLAAIVASGCTLLVDVDAVRAERDAGDTGGGTATGGGTTAVGGGGDSGGGVGGGQSGGSQTGGAGPGGGAGGGGVIYPDAGQCRQSANPRLPCLAPLVFEGTSFGPSDLAANDDGLWFALYRRDLSELELHQLVADGGHQVRRYPSQLPTSVSLSAAGSAWVLAWADGSANPHCAASFDDGGVHEVLAGNVKSIAVAVNARDEVMVGTARGNHTDQPRGAVAVAACPTTVSLIRDPMFGTVTIDQFDALRMPNEDLRLTGSGYSMALDRGQIGTYLMLLDGGVKTRNRDSQERPTDHVSAFSDDGSFIFSGSTGSGDGGVEWLKVRGFDLSAQIVFEYTSVEVLERASVMALSPAGVNRLAAATIRTGSPMATQLVVVSANNALEPVTPVYDVACERGGVPEGVSLLRVGGADVMVSSVERNRAELYRCALPQ